MSEDQKSVKRRVRDRQAKTGEKYQDAWRHLAGDESLPKSGPTQHLERRPLRLPLPMSSTGSTVLPGRAAQITGRPQVQMFCPDRLLIKRPEHWTVDLFHVGRGGQWIEDAGTPLFYRDPLIKKMPADAFAFDRWHSLREQSVIAGEDVVLTVTYHGPNKEGEPFEGMLFGWVDGRPVKVEIQNDLGVDAERISERVESQDVSVGARVDLELTVKAGSLFVDRLSVADARDWIVNDVRTKGGSIFVQDGDVPGEMFTDAARVVLVPLVKGDRVEVSATYVGKETSARLAFEISGAATIPAGKRDISYFLPMSTTTSLPILPTQSAQITGRPQKSFVPERTVVADDPNEWVINDVKVGNRAQFVQFGDVPAVSFKFDAVGCDMHLDVVPAGMDFVIITTFIGDDEKGKPFVCGVQGRLA